MSIKKNLLVWSVALLPLIGTAQPDASGHKGLPSDLTKTTSPHQGSTSLKDKGKDTAGAKKQSRYMALPRQDAESTPRFWASMADSDKGRNGMYEFDTKDNFTFLGYLDDDPYSGAWYKDGIYTAISAVSFSSTIVSAYLMEYDATTWDPGDYHEFPSVSFYASSSAYDNQTGYLYGCYWDGTGGWDFARVNIANDSKVVIKQDVDKWYSACIDSDGQLYAITLDGVVYKVNKMSGAMTELVNTGFDPYDSEVGSAVYSSRDKKIYWAMRNADLDAFLIEIDPVAATSKGILQFSGSEQVLGIIMAPDYESEQTGDFVYDAVPSMPTNLQYDFSNGFQGNVSFTMPTTTAKGSALEGEGQYKVYADGNLAAEGTAQYGSEVSTSIILSGYGSHTLMASAVNDRGEGSRVSVTFTLSENVDDNVIVPPYYNNFNLLTAIDNYTIINANGDDKTWEMYAEYAHIEDNAALDMDDWLVTPGVKLEAGKVYPFSIKAWCYDTKWPERLEVKMGTAPNAAAMTTAVIGSTDLTSDEATTLSNYISVNETGIYYIGIHGISDADAYYLCIDDLRIGEPITQGSPKEVSNFSAVADYEGAYKATVTLTAPTRNVLDNQDPTAITKIELKRNGDLIHTFNAPQPGEELSYVDEVGASGTYTYTARVICEDGYSSEASTSTYIGIARPGMPGSITVKEDPENPGMVTVSWEAPTVDANGYPFNPAFATYKLVELVDSEQVELVDNFEGTSYTYRAMGVDEPQEFKQYGVWAKSVMGYGMGIGSYPVVVGSPYTLSFYESFDDGEARCIFAERSDGYGSWYVYDDDDIQDTPDADGTNGYAVYVAQYTEDAGTFVTGKVAVKDVVNATLKFNTFKIVGYRQDVTGEAYRYPDMNTLAVLVSTDGGNNFETLHTFVIDELGEKEGWYEISMDLSKYIGKDICLGFEATCNGYAYTMLDNIQLIGVKIVPIDKLNYSVADNKVKLIWDIPRNVDAETIVGYNVFRNGTKITDTPVTTTSYSDDVTEYSNITYGVSVVYTHGESDPTNISVDLSGVEKTFADKASVEAVSGGFTINNSVGALISIYSVDGIVVYRGNDEGTHTVAAQPGIYTVTINNKANKLVVRN